MEGFCVRIADIQGELSNFRMKFQRGYYSCNKTQVSENTSCYENRNTQSAMKSVGEEGKGGGAVTKVLSLVVVVILTFRNRASYI